MSIWYCWDMPSDVADFHETDVELNRKVLAALAAGLRVLFAVGETAEERIVRRRRESVLRQLKIGLHGVQPEAPAAAPDRLRAGLVDRSRWRPGQPGGRRTHRRLDQSRVPRSCSRQPGSEIPILYGGSVDPSNAGNLHRPPRHRRSLRRPRGLDGRAFITTYTAGYEGVRVTGA